MMKGHDWTFAELKEVGGTQGVGVNFLAEIFTAQTVVPRHRMHQKASRAVLRVMLPESGRNQHYALLWGCGFAASKICLVSIER
ncbi:MAG: hypothetical protein ACPGLY_23945 [Rubripirellula sp.]